MIAYNRDIPDGPHSPSADQPLMKTNTNSTYDIINVDHYTFGAGNDGKHKQSTYPNFATPGAVVDPVGVIYTANGVAGPGHAQAYFKNSQGVFPVSGIKAVANFSSLISTDSGAIAPAIGGSINVTGILQTGGFTGSWVISLNANTINSNGVAVFVFTSAPVTILSYSPNFVSNQLTINFQGPFAVVTVNVMMFQL